MKKVVENHEAMLHLGESIGRYLRGGEVIELVGDVGAGKTTFTKGLARGLDIAEDVGSPSFTISRVYDGRNDIHLNHYDFYRLDDAGIMAQELADVMTDQKSVVIIEWADAVKNVLPHGHLRIRFVSPSETTRELLFEAEDEKLLKILERL